MQIKQDNSRDNPRIVQVKLLAPPAKKNSPLRSVYPYLQGTTLP